MSRSRSIEIALTLALALLAGVARAQDFGGNKVHYNRFDFRILQTKHFDVYYYPEERDAALQAARLAERCYAQISERFQHQLHDRQPLILYASHPEFRQTNLVPGSPGEGTGGLTEGQKNRIVMPFGVGLAETGHVLAHELVHAFQYDLAKHGNPSILDMPLWFIEGMAEYVSIGPDDTLTATWMRDIVRRQELPDVKDLDHARYFPYRYGHALWSYLASRFGDDVVRKMLVATSSKVTRRLKAVTGLDADRISNDWHAALVERFAAPAGAVASASTPIIRSVGSGRLNVSPSLSPDGSQVVFLSERDQLSVDAYLADARTGTIRRKIVSTATDPHFDSLQFIDSAGAWDPAGRRFAFTAISGGRPVLEVLDMAETGRTGRELPLEGLGQAYQPTWSPDGRQIAFSGLKGGASDLYVYDFRADTLRQLTADEYADVQPAWSPDGRQIAFVTDRFSSDLRTLRAGTYRLALLDLASGESREIGPFPAARSIDPHWSADGRSLYFLADPDGITNVYRLHLADRRVYRVTNVATGVSGITALSPALSVARDTGTLAFSLYEGGGYDICTLDTPDALLGEAVTAATTGVDAGQAAGRGPATGAATPPPDGEHAVAAARPMTGGTASGAAAPAGPDSPATPAAPNPTAAWWNGRDFTVKRYRRSLSFDGIGQPYFTAGGGRFGTFFRAGMAFSLGDMLRDQQVDAAVQVGRRKEDFAGQFVYLNRRSRWNWGVGAEYLPVVFGQATSVLAGTADAPAIATQVDYFRQIHRGVSGLAIYPFSRADRIELGAGLESITYAQEIRNQVVTLATGQVESDVRQAVPGRPPVLFADTRVAFVHDTAVHGPTGPILGSRYRLEVAPALGGLSFATLLADYRRYVVPVKPFTLAFRVRYLGRHGRDGSDPGLLPLVYGVRDEVRGYNLRSLAIQPCSADPAAGCPDLAILNSSRLLVANAELRFPLRGLFSRTYNYGALPIDGIVFADGGSLWTRTGPGDAPWIRSVLRSVGAGVRVNAGGIVFEFAAVRPFDRPATGWTFSFNLLPGF